MALDEVLKPLAAAGGRDRRGVLAQLTAEKAIRKYVKGRGAVRQWVKLRERNEAPGLEVYALAALYIGGPALLRDLAGRATRFARPAEAKGEGEWPPSTPGAYPQVRMRSRALNW